MRNTALSVSISVYWPFWLVCICAVILVMIALLALLLLRGTDDFSVTGKVLHAVLDRKKQEWQRSQISDRQPVHVQFFRIGRDGDTRDASLLPDVWYDIGSSEKADFCLDPDDPKLSQKHFRLCINGSAMTVISLEKETFVNGVPIQSLGKILVCSGDLIRAGSYEYRVIFSLSNGKERAT